MLGIRGLVAATFTPLDAEGSIQLDAVGPMVDGLIGKGISGLYIVGSTGEGVSLTTEERKTVAQEFVRAVDGRIKTIIQVGHNSVREAVGLAQHAGEIGASAISASPPSYFNMSDVGSVFDCIEPILTATPALPFYYYHIPMRTRVAIDVVELLKRCEGYSSFQGVKFTSPEVHEFQAALQAAGDRFELFYGCDEMLLSALVIGARAAVGSTYNFATRLFLDIAEAFRVGELERAAQLQGYAVQLIHVLARHGGLSSFKAMMKRAGYDCGPVRAPLRSLTSDEVAACLRDLEAADLLRWIDAPA